jgi:hypothetical protein
MDPMCAGDIIHKAVERRCAWEERRIIPTLNDG